MRVEEATLEVEGESYPGRVNVPDGAPDLGVLVIPGAGHGPFGDVFDRFAEAAAESGYLLVRFETWEGRADLARKTDEDFAAEIDAGVAFLRSRGCSTVAVVGKSFGGRLALEHAPGTADRMVLWAPAVRVGDRDDYPSITAAELAAIEVPVRILQGDEDEVASVGNAASLAEHLPEGELVELAGEDHSFQGDQRRTVEETLAFLET